MEYCLGGLFGVNLGGLDRNWRTNPARWDGLADADRRDHGLVAVGYLAGGQRWHPIN